MDDIDHEIREIKREIVESRGLSIKTNNLTSALSADLKSIGKRQLAYERRALWNGVGMSALFILAVVGAVKLAWDARMESVTAETHASKEKLARLETEIGELRKRGDERLAAESEAAGFYELLRAGRRQEVVDQFDALRKRPLSRAELAFLGDATDQARSELSIKSYELGLDHMRTGRWHEAATAFEESIQRKEIASHIPSARLNLAQSYRKLGRQRDAIPVLLQIVEVSPDKEIMDDATLLLAECYVDMQAWNDAKTTLRSFLKRFPDSPLANDAKLALADVSLRH